MNDEPYGAFAERLVASEIILDPWLAGAPRFREPPIVLAPEEASELAKIAADVVATYHEGSLLVADRPELLGDYFSLTPAQQTMWTASQPFWHAHARVDLFQTPDGPVISEINCDTPTGQAEAAVLGRMAARARPDLRDPNADLGARFVAMLEWVGHRTLEPRVARKKTAGIVYPTEFTEDLPLVRLLVHWLEEADWNVVLGSPYNLTEERDGSVCLMGTPITTMLRHYKTDWWGERSSPWMNDVIADTSPLERPLSIALRAQMEGRLAVVNPFGAVLPQNKRMMAFLWEHIHELSTRAQAVVERHIPVTRRLENVHEEQLFAQREEWVIKSDYGCEGEEVIVGPAVTDEAWRLAIAEARPGRWVAQRYFRAETNDDGEITNLGVYVVAGEPAGIYARVSRGPTDGRALSVPLLMG
ncbi:MAG: glutathionylspermidine synthase family protein [Polyangiaceae bacterium]